MALMGGFFLLNRNDNALFSLGERLRVLGIHGLLGCHRVRTILVMDTSKQRLFHAES